MRRPTRILLAVAAATGAANVIAAPPAASAAECTTSLICGWSGYGFVGTVTTFTAGAGCRDMPFPLRGILNTYPAGSTVAADVYSQTGCTGRLLAHLGPGQGRAFLVPSGLSVLAQ